MTGKTHKLIGITAGLGLYLQGNNLSYNPATLSAVVVAAYFGSLLPDLDNANSDFWDSVPLGHTAARITDPWVKHRNLTHSLLGIFLFSSLLLIILKIFPEYWGIDVASVWIVFVVAYVLHIFADMFTVEGVPLLFPWHRNFGIPPKPFDGIRILSGKWFENLVIFPIVNLLLILLIISNWSNLKSILFK